MSMNVTRRSCDVSACVETLPGTSNTMDVEIAIASPSAGQMSHWQVHQATLMRWLGLLSIAVVFIAMSVWSWRKWPDVFVDFGSQLYFPWQVSGGRHLYRDLEYVGGGPLSQYYHALLFQWFHVSMTTLVVSSLVILGGLTLLIYGVFQKIADTTTALAISLLFLLIFAFSEYVWVGNYNFVCAYSTEAVHGLVISLVTLVLLAQWLAKRRPAFAIGAGFGAGLVLMTKPELFLALALTLILAFVLALRVRANLPPGFVARSVIAFLVGAIAPLSIATILFSRSFGMAGALPATLGAWMSVLTSSAAKTPFYQWCLGFDHPGQNALTMLRWFSGYALAIAATAWLCCRFPKADRPIERVVLGVALAGIVLGSFDVPWLECGWPLPLATACIGLHLGAVWWKRPAPAQDFRSILPIFWSGFALFLLSKMILHSRIWHYGFYLAMPAFLINVYYLAEWLPERLRCFGMQKWLFRTVLFTVLGIAAFRLVSRSDQFYAAKTYAVGPGADRILTFPPRIHPRAEGIVATAKWLSENTPENATVAVLPDGLILNYLSRRPNPTRYSSLTPLELAAYGEQKILDAYRAHTPDYIVLMHRSSEEFNLGYFGQDPANGAAVMRWIKQDYEPAWLWGHEPLQTEQFGIKVLKLKQKRLASR